jgi:hypothetical protein
MKANPVERIELPETGNSYKELTVPEMIACSIDYERELMVVERPDGTYAIAVVLTGATKDQLQGQVEGALYTLGSWVGLDEMDVSYVAFAHMND